MVMKLFIYSRIIEVGTYIELCRLNLSTFYKYRSAATAFPIKATKPPW